MDVARNACNTQAHAQTCIMATAKSSMIIIYDAFVHFSNVCVRESVCFVLRWVIFSPRPPKCIFYFSFVLGLLFFLFTNSSLLFVSLFFSSLIVALLLLSLMYTQPSTSTHTHTPFGDSQWFMIISDTHRKLHECGSWCGSWKTCGHISVRNVIIRTAAAVI